MKIIRTFTFLFCCAFISNQAWAIQTLEYSILKEGEPIGREVVKIKEINGQIIVDVWTKTDVELLFLKFAYEHNRTEIWQDDELISMESKTNDDGEDHFFQLKRQGNNLVLLKNQKKEILDGEALPLSLWSKNILNQKILLSVIDAKPFKVKTTALGKNHFRLEGDVSREMWFAKDGYLKKAAFKRRGFTVEFLRK